VSEPRLRAYFACVGNSGRSQMAEAFCRELGGEAVACSSGGTEPHGEVLATVEAAMAEVGIDLDGHASTAIDPDAVREADVVVTMGCGAQACPAFHGVEVRDWLLEDPKDADPATVRAIRDDVEQRVRDLLAEHGVEPIGDLAGPEA